MLIEDGVLDALPLSYTGFYVKNLFTPTFLLYVFLVCFKGEIHNDLYRIRTWDIAMTICWSVRNTDYQLGHAPLLESLLEMNVSECIYKDIKIFL